MNGSVADADGESRSILPAKTDGRSRIAGLGLASWGATSGGSQGLKRGRS